MMKRIWKSTRTFFSGRKREPLSRVEAVFDRNFYLASNVDVEQSRMEPWRHFLSHGWEEGRNPHPSFDVGWYLECNSDVAIKGTNPFEHFVLYGWREGRQPMKGMVCDRVACLDQEADPDSFNPFDYLVSANGDYHDWSERIRELVSTDLDQAIRLCETWKHGGGEGNVAPVVLLAELLTERGDFVGAAAEIEEILKMDLEETEVLLSLAECAIKAGNWESYQEIVERLEKGDPDFFEVPTQAPQRVRLQAFKWLNEKRLLEAFASFDQLATMNSEDGLACFGRGLVLLEFGSGDESFDDFWRALRLLPTLEPAKVLMDRLWSDLFAGSESETPTDILKELDDWTQFQGEETLAKLNRLDGDSPAVNRLKAHARLARGDVEVAIELFASLASTGPHASQARSMLARIHSDTRDFSSALVEFHQLNESDLDSSYLTFRILDLSDRTGRQSESNGLLDSNESGCLEMGKALMLKDCHRTAAECFESSAGNSGSNDADRLDSLGGLGQCLMKSGEYERARSTALEALEIDPDASESSVVVGAVSRCLGNHNEAIRRYEKAIESKPQESWVYQELAAELDRKGDRGAAILVLEAGLKIHDSDPNLCRDDDRLGWLDRLQRLSDSISRAQSAGRSGSPESHVEFVSLLRTFIDADWPVIGRDLAECRVYMDEVIRKGENWPLHLAYGDLLVRSGNKFDALGYYEEAHRTAAKNEHYEDARPILRKIIAILEQLELYGRCLTYLEQLVHGMPASECRSELRRLACFSAMLGKRDEALGYWHTLRTARSS